MSLVEGFEKFLDWLQDQDKEPDAEALSEYGVDTRYPIEYLNAQLYSVLANVTEGNACQVVMNLQNAHDTRGARAWFRLTRDVEEKPGHA